MTNRRYGTVGLVGVGTLPATSGGRAFLLGLTGSCRTPGVIPLFWECLGG